MVLVRIESILIRQIRLVVQLLMLIRRNYMVMIRQVFFGLISQLILIRQRACL